MKLNPAQFTTKPMLLNKLKQMETKNKQLTAQMWQLVEVREKYARALADIISNQGEDHELSEEDAKHWGSAKRLRVPPSGIDFAKTPTAVVPHRLDDGATGLVLYMPKVEQKEEQKEETLESKPLDPEEFKKESDAGEWLAEQRAKQARGE